MRAADLLVQGTGGRLRIVLPTVRFLTGRPLERLRQGAPVTYDMQLSVGPASRTATRCVVSYDLWEERFAVSLARAAAPARTGLTAQAAESWCVDGLSLPLTSLPAGRLRARLEVRATDADEDKRPFGEEGLSLGTLIDLFSRPPERQQFRVELVSAPFSVAELAAGGPSRPATP